MIRNSGFVLLRKAGDMRETVPDTSQRGRITEDDVKIEIEANEPRISGTQFVNERRIRGEEGSNSSRFDLLYLSEEAESGEEPVDANEVMFGVEVKTFLSHCKITRGDQPTNEKVEQFQQHTDAPFFVVGIRHYCTPEENREVSDADETVSIGYIYSTEEGETHKAEKMLNEGEFDRLMTAIREVIDTET